MDSLNEYLLFLMARQPLVETSRYRSFTIKLRHTTVSRTPLNDWSARSRDLYLTTHSTHKRQTGRPPAGFEPTIPASERPQTHSLLI